MPRTSAQPKKKGSSQTWKTWWMNPTPQELAWWEGLSRDDKIWWARFADDARYAADAASEALPHYFQPEEVWDYAESWIYTRFEQLVRRFPDYVLTGISGERLHSSMQLCTRRHSRRELPWGCLREGTRAYIQLAKRKGLGEVRAWQESWLAGNEDRSGLWWCGKCFLRARLMDVGAACDYAARPPHMGEGCEEWLKVAQTASDVLIETIVRAVDKQVIIEGLKGIEA